MKTTSFMFCMIMVSLLCFFIYVDSHQSFIDVRPTAVAAHMCLPTGIEALIVEESTRAGISAHLPLRIAWRESRYSPGAVGRSPNGQRDWGVFQLADSTVRTLHVAHPLDARQNVIAGVGLIAAYLRLCGSERSAARAFATGTCK